MTDEAAFRGNRTDIAEGPFLPSQEIEKIDVLAPKKRPPNPSRFKFERVNEVTWKLTNGEMTNVPASHGQWPGYRVSKAIAWVIDVGIEKPAWIARHKDHTTNPMQLQKAKKAALAMAKGECGDYVVRDQIAHLNGLAARLTDGETATLLRANLSGSDEIFYRFSIGPYTNA